MSENLNKDKVIDALKEVFDPEIPVNIVDLGLIYDVAIDGTDVEVKMTLTAAGCGMGPYIAQQAEWAISELDDVEDVNCNFGVSNFDFRFTAANATLMSAKYKAEQNILHLTAVLSDNLKSI